jgi:hypothetical protein
VKDELDRQTAINLELRRKLERVRRETVEYCAKFCEDHEMGLDRGVYICAPAQADRTYTHPGDGYAKGLRGIIGATKKEKKNG